MKIATLVLSILFPMAAHAETLSAEAIYYRCYAQLTGHRAADNDPMLAKLRAGQVKASDACMDLLDSAKLARSQNDYLKLAKNSEEGRAVLARMQELHTTFFAERTFNVPNVALAPIGGLLDVMDPGSSALYYTRALLGPNVQASSIVTYNRALRPFRTDMNPAKGLFRKVNRGGFYYTNGWRFAPQGELLGLEEMPGGSEKLTGPGVSIDISRTLGGGFLGSGAYLMQSVNDDFEFETNVAKMPRRWATAVFRDVLCREFPVVRLEDAKSFVRPQSPLPFRQEQACNQCHSSMDRIGSVLRNFHYSYFDNKALIPPDKRGAMFFKTFAADKPAEAGWPDRQDNDFKNRPTRGTLYFRSATDGSLEKPTISSVHDLGQKMAAQDDFYLCIANRYYDYFTAKGIKLDDAKVLNDLAAKDKTGALKKRLDTVKTLARELKKTQSLRGLVEDIIRSPEYSDSAFGQ